MIASKVSNLDLLCHNVPSSEERLCLSVLRGARRKGGTGLGLDYGPWAWLVHSPMCILEYPCKVVSLSTLLTSFSF